MTSIPDGNELTFNEYQELSKKTAIFPEVNSELAVSCLTFLAATSKVAGVIKKLFRDSSGKMTPEIKAKLLGAIEGVWEELDFIEGIVYFDVADRKDTNGVDPTVVYPLLGYADEVGELIEKCVQNDPEAAKELGDTNWYAAQIATALNVESGEIAHGNLAKLFDRLERKVLQGSGDNR